MTIRFNCDLDEFQQIESEATAVLNRHNLKPNFVKTDRSRSKPFECWRAAGAILFIQSVRKRMSEVLSGVDIKTGMAIHEAIAESLKAGAYWQFSFDEPEWNPFEYREVRKIVEKNPKAKHGDINRQYSVKHGKKMNSGRLCSLLNYLYAEGVYAVRPRTRRTNKKA